MANTPVTEKTMLTKTTDPNHSRPPKPSKQISHHSDWSNSEDGKDDQARAKPICPFKIFKLKES